MKLLFRQRFFSWLDSYDVYYENGQIAYTVEGKFVCSCDVGELSETLEELHT